MTLWLFQIALDLAFASVVVLYFYSQRRNRSLETEVHELHENLLELRRSLQAGSGTQPTAADALGAPRHAENADPAKLSAPAHLAGPAPILKESIDSPLGSPVSTLAARSLAEKSVQEQNRSVTADAYDRAEALIARGLPLKEISRQTGLSVSELQLLGKMAQRNH